MCLTAGSICSMTDMIDDLSTAINSANSRCYWQWPVYGRRFCDSGPRRWAGFSIFCWQFFLVPSVRASPDCYWLGDKPG